MKLATRLLSSLGAITAFVLALGSGNGALPIEVVSGNAEAVFADVSNTPDVSQYPRLAIDPSGTAYLVWKEQVGGDVRGQIFYATNLGGRWAAPVPLTNWGSQKYVGNIAVDSTGNKYVVWADYGSSQSPSIYFSKGTSSGGWTKPIQMSTQNMASYDPTITVDAAGRIYMAWSEKRSDTNFDIWYTSSPNGASWERPTNLSANEGWSRQPALAISNAGAVIVAWQDAQNGDEDIVVRILQNGSWTNSFNVSGNPGRSIAPALATDNTGAIYAVWQDSSEGQYQIYYRACRSGQWSGISNISNAPGAKALEPTIAVGPGDAIAIAWRMGYLQSTGAEPRDYQIYWTKGNGSSWQLPTNISRFSRPAYTPDLAPGKDGLSLAFWGPESGNHEIYYSKIDPDLSLPSPSTPTAPSPEPSNTSGNLTAASALVGPGGDPNERYFPETQHNLGNGFRYYWERYGGLSQFGYPLTEEFLDVLPKDGQLHPVQYTERARLEYYPENRGTLFEVQLGLLGREAIAGRSFTAATPFESDANHWYFPETQHSLSYGFLAYWLTHGGLATYGYPISEELKEVSPTAGKEYTAQYFERNRFEYHPENAGTPFEIQLGLLGREMLDRGTR